MHEERRAKMYGNMVRFAKRQERGYIGQAKGVSDYVLDKLRGDPYIVGKLERAAAKFRKYLKTDRLTVYLSKEKKVSK